MSGEERPNCPLCLEPIRFYATAPCNHNSICAHCVLRLWLLYDQKECSICKQSVNKLFLSAAPMDYPQRFTTFIVDEEKQLVYDSIETQTAIEAIWQLQCFFCGQANFQTVQDLQFHVETRHHRYMCSLCLEHRRIFISEQRTYTKKQLAKHMLEGLEEERPFNGHPQCPVCHEHFFDQSDLLQHLRDSDHHYCHVCVERKEAVAFENARQLEQHYRDEHFLCSAGQCRLLGCVVFGTGSEFLEHTMQEHPDCLDAALELINKRKAELANEGITEDDAANMEGSPERFDQIPPEIIAQKNRQLVAKLSEFFHGDEALFNSFRHTSADYAHGTMDVKTYFGHVRRALGLFMPHEDPQAQNLFFLLVSTLPDRHKRQQLNSLYDEAMKNHQMFPSLPTVIRRTTAGEILGGRVASRSDKRTDRIIQAATERHRQTGKRKRTKRSGQQIMEVDLTKDLFRR